MPNLKRREKRKTNKTNINYGGEAMDWGQMESSVCNHMNQQNVEGLIDSADKIGRALKNENLKTNQIRRFLDGVRKIEANIKRRNFEEVKDQILLLIPKLAYAAGRHNEVKPLMRVLVPAIKKGAENQKNFENLLRFVESIIAYHKFYGGKD